MVISSLLYGTAASAQERETTDLNLRYVQNVYQKYCITQYCINPKKECQIE
jgi:hypothetical protein